MGNNMENHQRTIPWVLALVAVGIALGGWFVGQGFVQGRTADRFVTVKGLAERDVEADIALWPIQFAATDDQLDQAQARIRDSRQEVLAFLAGHGIAAEAVQVHRLSVQDLYANAYRSGPVQSRFIIQQTLMVRSTETERIEKASQAIGELVDAGVILSSEGPMSNGPTYLFSRLGDHKPAMIAEATANARRAAEEFAADSGSRLGKIRRANQGVFVILARDRAPGIDEQGQRQKTIRVVTTIEYLLE
ncbi:MAG: SIMPL domain-containing protein [Desulfobacteraceae bacterium]|nr:SIMPL domain-containing protein [Desulfobacteraceae bacterium]